MFVKVCGLSTASDVAAAVDAGADAVGFVVAPSPRQIDLATVRELVPAAGERMTVLLTVDATASELLEMAAVAGVTAVQPYGAHSAGAGVAAATSGLFVLRPIPVGDRLVGLDSIPDDQLPLFDTRVAGLHGGTGVSFDWSLLEAIERDFVLAGGLGPDTVADAIARVHPWGVDASSGLESSPGRKDHGRIRAFVEGARQ
ncbi:MAG: phosphoribosylanthranilate isomerase [Acidimicrobiia bacterium]|nr:phosphoribosylanthranilate isomerase [Acidimicrobiia bacterium]